MPIDVTGGNVPRRKQNGSALAVGLAAHADCRRAQEQTHSLAAPAQMVIRARQDRTWMLHNQATAPQTAAATAARPEGSIVAGGARGHNGKADNDQQRDDDRDKFHAWLGFAMQVCSPTRRTRSAKLQHGRVEAAPDIVSQIEPRRASNWSRLRRRCWVRRMLGSGRQNRCSQLLNG
jgi:hypothetical protein